MPHKMLKNKKAVLFDLDGTLIDSMNTWVKIDAVFGEKYGIVFEDTFHDAIEGMSFTETATYFKTHYLMKQSVEEIKQEWLTMAHIEYRDVIPYKKGARELLRYLQGNGYKTAICTSNSHDLVNAMSTRLTEFQHIDYILTACDVKAGKPAPDVYLQAAEALGVSVQECLVFEDIPNGILAGKNAGMEVCAVDDEFSEYLREQKQALADYYISDFTQVLNAAYEE